MKTTHCFNPFSATLAVVAFTITLALAADRPLVVERIGIYDSRAVAVAYVGSTAQATKMKDLTTRLNKARHAGDTNAVARVEAEGRAWQMTLKQQGFGTAPVGDLLAEIAEDIPAIQKRTGVTDLVSKWDKTGLTRHPGAEQVDVTMLLVDAFRPNTTQRKHAIEIQKKKPQRILK
jgi:hypothetical protein